MIVKGSRVFSLTGTRWESYQLFDVLALGWQVAPAERITALLDVDGIGFIVPI